MAATTSALTHATGTADRELRVARLARHAARAVQALRVAGDHPAADALADAAIQIADDIRSGAL